MQSGDRVGLQVRNDTTRMNRLKRSRLPRFDKENMDTASILQELRRQRDQLAEAIIAFERLAAGAGPRRGRPPKWLAAAKEPGTAAPAEKPATKKRRASKKAK